MQIPGHEGRAGMVALSAPPQEKKEGGEGETSAAERSLSEMLKRRLSSPDDNRNIKEEEVEEIDPKGGEGDTEEDKLSALLKELYKRMVRDLILFFCFLDMEIRLLLSSSHSARPSPRTPAPCSSAWRSGWR